MKSTAEDLAHIRRDIQQVLEEMDQEKLEELQAQKFWGEIERIPMEQYGMDLYNEHKEWEKSNAF